MLNKTHKISITLVGISLEIIRCTIIMNRLYKKTWRLLCLLCMLSVSMEVIKGRVGYFKAHMGLTEGEGDTRDPCII